jgi:hypothetical protein
MACCLAMTNAGSNIAPRIAIMAITTNNSMSLKPLLGGFELLLTFGNSAARGSDIWYWCVVFMFLVEIRLTEMQWNVNRAQSIFYVG